MKNNKTKVHSWTRNIISMLFIILLFLSVVEVNGQDTIQVQPYHEVSPNNHLDTLFLQGSGVSHLVDSTGTAVFIYDPNEGLWRFEASLSNGLINN